MLHNSLLAMKPPYRAADVPHAIFTIAMTPTQRSATNLQRKSAADSLQIDRAAGNGGRRFIEENHGLRAARSVQQNRCASDLLLTSCRCSDAEFFDPTAS